jgi:hypothetical protein
MPTHLAHGRAHTHTPRKAIHGSLSDLPKLEKSQETRSNTLHMENYFPIFRDCTPRTQVPYVYL